MRPRARVPRRVQACTLAGTRLRGIPVSYLGRAVQSAAAPGAASACGPAAGDIGEEVRFLLRGLARIFTAQLNALSSAWCCSGSLPAGQAAGGCEGRVGRLHVSGGGQQECAGVQSLSVLHSGSVAWSGKWHPNLQVEACFGFRARLIILTGSCVGGSSTDVLWVTQLLT